MDQIGCGPKAGAGNGREPLSATKACLCSCHNRGPQLRSMVYPRRRASSGREKAGGTLPDQGLAAASLLAVAAHSATAPGSSPGAGELSRPRAAACGAPPRADAPQHQARAHTPLSASTPFPTCQGPREQWRQAVYRRAGWRHFWQPLEQLVSRARPLVTGYCSTGVPLVYL